jgi:hypothetical protein
MLSFLPVTTSLRADTAASLALRPLPEQLFRNDGEYWTLAFEGIIYRIKDIRGLHYLARLLQNPDKELHVLTLVTGSADPQGGAQAQFSPLGLSDEGSTERARINVTRAIKAAIKKIAVSHSALGQYLSRTIKTGTFCSYVPEPHQSSSWRF